MKKFLFLVLALFLIFLFSCNTKENNDDEKEEIEETPFQIIIDDNIKELGFVLANDNSFSESSVKLEFPLGLKISPVTFSDIDFCSTIKNDGFYSNDNIISYTFYLKNNGNNNESLDLNLNVTKVTKNVDKAFRVAVIENGSVEGKIVKFDNGKIFLRNDGHGDEVALEKINPETDYTNEKIVYGKDFYDQFEIVKVDDNNSFGSLSISDIAKGDIIKYTVVFWLEGWDDDCNDEILFGEFKMDLVFSLKK